MCQQDSTEVHGDRDHLAWAGVFLWFWGMWRSAFLQIGMIFHGGLSFKFLVGTHSVALENLRRALGGHVNFWFRQTLLAAYFHAKSSCSRKVPNSNFLIILYPCSGWRQSAKVRLVPGPYHRASEARQPRLLLVGDQGPSHQRGALRLDKRPLCARHQPAVAQQGVAGGQGGTQFLDL